MAGTPTQRGLQSNMPRHGLLAFAELSSPDNRPNTAPEFGMLPSRPNFPRVEPRTLNGSALDRLHAELSMKKAKLATHREPPVPIETVHQWTSENERNLEEIEQLRQDRVHLEARIDAHSLEIQQLHAQQVAEAQRHAEEVTNLTLRHDQAIATLTKQHQQEVKRLTQQHAEQLAVERKERVRALTHMSEQYEERELDLTRNYELRLNDTAVRYEERLASTARVHERQITDQVSSLSRQIRDLREQGGGGGSLSEAPGDVAGDNRSSNRDIALTLEKSHEDALKEERLRGEAALVALRAEHERTLQEMRESHTTRETIIKDDHADEANQLREELEICKSEVQAQVEAAEKKLTEHFQAQMAAAEERRVASERDTAVRLSDLRVSADSADAKHARELKELDDRCNQQLLVLKKEAARQVEEVRQEAMRDHQKQLDAQAQFYEKSCADLTQEIERVRAEHVRQLADHIAQYEQRLQSERAGM